MGAHRRGHNALKLRVMRAVQSEPGLPARAPIFSLGATNYALKALIGQGLVKADNFVRADKKAGYLMVLVRLLLARLARDSD